MKESSKNKGNFDSVSKKIDNYSSEMANIIYNYKNILNYAPTDPSNIKPKES